MALLHRRLSTDSQCLNPSPLALLFQFKCKWTSIMSLFKANSERTVQTLRQPSTVICGRVWAAANWKLWIKVWLNDICVLPQEDDGNVIQLIMTSLLFTFCVISNTAAVQENGQNINGFIEVQLKWKSSNREDPLNSAPASFPVCYSVNDSFPPPGNSTLLVLVHCIDSCSALC